MACKPAVRPALLVGGRCGDRTRRGVRSGRRAGAVKKRTGTSLGQCIGRGCRRKGRSGTGNVRAFPAEGKGEKQAGAARQMPGPFPAARGAAYGRSGALQAAFFPVWCQVLPCPLEACPVSPPRPGRFVRQRRRRMVAPVCGTPETGMQPECCRGDCKGKAASPS